ncbi:hypothetical protein BKG82_26590 [Mycobacteroides chelonae]|uniref:Nucleotidyl transferase AbiEii/AbiGii toxin family protein n=1 Tax=Mycobacteroides chelonae TaxID=1774 RepID=A0A1S1LII6_MYCCH|nr:nucleotidyl transferase AbiEii/AbiGii toxin family protein [Mycobacteroides chelonae]OHU47226.1 hypothetical protein BKG82_26590 [Mycobacteroides chelonae]
MNTYKTPAAFHTAVEHRLKEAARRTGRPVNELRRQYLSQRFLARVFGRADSEWVLLGGTALLTRIPGARHSMDVDFVHAVDLQAALKDLAARLDHRPAPDPYRFEIASASTPVDDHQSIKIAVYAGVAVVERFSVDITRRPGAVRDVEVLSPQPVVHVDDVAELPTFVAVSLAQQVADKLCAMYETHGAAATPSSRFRDLVDLVVISTHSSSLQAAAAITAVAAEQRRRGITIPPELPLPSHAWTAGYRKQAASTSAVPADLNTAAAALGQLVTFARPLLEGTAAGTWDPRSKRWTSR